MDTSSLAMTQDKVVNLKRMKHLFLLFLKQFEVDEYKLLMQFLQLIINKYKLNPSTLFGFLTNQIENDEDELFESNQYKRGPNIINPKQRHYQQLKHAQNKAKLNKQGHTVLSSQSFEAELDEDNIKFDDNDDDADIDYLDENYNEPLANGAIKTEFDLNTLKDRVDILNSFVMKPYMSDNEEFCDELNAQDFNEQDEFAESYFNENENCYGDELYNDQYPIYQSNDYQDNYYENPEQHQDDYTLNEAQWDSSFNDSIKFNPSAHDSATATKLLADVTQLDSKFRVRKFSDSIRSELERKFLENNFISGIEKTQLATRLGLTERQVQKWFVHRREKLRRQEKKAGIKNESTSQQINNQAKANIQPIRTKLNTQPPPLLRVNRPAAPRKQIDIKKFNVYNSAENPYKKVYLTRKSTEPLARLRNENSGEKVVGDDDEQMNDANINEINNNFDEDTNYSNHTASNFDSSNNDLNDDENFGQEDGDNCEDFKENNNNQENHLKFLLYPTKDLEHHETPEVSQLNSNELNVKRRRLTVTRRLFSPHVVTHLESLFDTEKYLKDHQIEKISQNTKLNEKQIRSWFKQRRFRYNLENKQKGIDQDVDINHFADLSEEAIEGLEKAFEKNNYVYGNDKKVLSRQFGLRPNQLERWFYHRRKQMASYELSEAPIESLD